MYYPLLRGRQNELLAIKELLSNSTLSNKIVPIIEPVKLSPTLVNTLDAFSEANRPIILIRNPKVGSFATDARNSKNEKYLNKLREIAIKPEILRGIIADSEMPDKVNSWYEDGVDDSQIISICTNPDFIKYHELAFNDKNSIKTVVPYAPAFRKIHTDRILLDDKFNKKSRNQDYSEDSDEFFSNDHLYYLEDNYLGFSDYSIIGNEYSESGFAPYAVAIHIVYFDDNMELRVRHFVSEDNDDISDPANKFYQALDQLVEWNKSKKLDTFGIKMFEKIHAEESYPGLGIVKKLSLMHHLELIGRYLDGVIV